MDRRTFNKRLALAGFVGSVATQLVPQTAAPRTAPSPADAAKLSPIDFDAHSFRIDGKPIHLYSGEFHYFRVPRRDWRRRMDLFREAGGNCIATYVPWLIHEPAEGRFVFGGEDGVHDLEGFLETARQAGLYVLARPGPYQYSELLYDGLPGWLCENYPELRARNFEGKPFRTSSVSYLHPLFLEKVRAWFGRVCPILAKHTVSHGGPIAFTQLDNEMIGIQVWFGSLDYNEVTMGFGKPEGRYPRFLRERYGSIDALNEHYGTKLTSFEAARPPDPSGPPSTTEIRRRKDYWDFYRGTIAEYARTLASLLRSHGIDTPLVHNSAGPDMNADFSETVKAMGPHFLLGSDHYYNLDQNWPQNNPTPQYARAVFYSLEMLRLMGFPPTVFELPGGSASDWPPVTPSDCKACYWTNLALGMKGNNYYIFTGGPNPQGVGATTDLYDYGAAIGAKNEIRPLYDVQKEFGLYLKARPWLQEAEREFDCRFALNFEYPRSGQYWSAPGDFLLSNSGAWEFFVKGALTSGFCASLSPALVDLAKDDWTRDLASPLVVVSSASMAADFQERLVRFWKRGGKVLLAPVVPTFDENLRLCTVLAQALGSPEVVASKKEFVRLTVAGVVNVLNNGAVFFSGPPGGGESLGKDELSGKTFAWSRHSESGGEIIFLGFRWVHAMQEHARMMASLLGLLGLREKVQCSNPNVWTSLRTYENKSALFIMNLLSSPMEAEVRCRPGARQDWVDSGRHRLGPMTVKCVEL